MYEAPRLVKHRPSRTTQCPNTEQTIQVGGVVDFYSVYPKAPLGLFQNLFRSMKRFWALDVLDYTESDCIDTVINLPVGLTIQWHWVAHSFASNHLQTHTHSTHCIE